jgi:Outer membrane protein beta-barrel domain
VRQVMGVQNPTHTSALIIAAIELLGLPGGNAMADDLLGMYIGGSVDQSHVRSDQVLFYKPDGTPLTSAVSVAKSATGWKLLVGMRRISWVGAELAYVDFGNPTASHGRPPGFGLSYNVGLRAKAATAFGVLCAPIPIPRFDLYAKAGLARLQTSVNGDAYYGCYPPLLCAIGPGAVHSNQTSTRFAYGTGMQARFAAIGIRVEYERISASGGDPDLLSLGVTWSF